MARNLPLLVHRHLGDRDVVAPLAVDKEMLGALADPFDRPADAPGGERRQRVLVIDERLGAEAAADVRGDHPDLADRHAEDIGDVVAHAVAALGAEGEREAAALRVVLGDDAARLHVVGDDPVVDDLHPRYPRRAGEGGVGRRLVAAVDLEGDVGREFGPDRRRAVGKRRLHVGDDRQRLVVDRDRVRRGLRRLDVIGDDEGDRIADVADGIPAKQRPVGHLRPGAVDLAHARLARQRADPVEVGVGHDEVHARHRARLVETGEADPRVRHRRAQHDRAQRARRREIVGVVAGAGHQRLVLEPAHRRAHAELGRCGRVHGFGSPRNVRIAAISPAVEASRPPAGAPSSTIGSSSPASVLPNSTPHWSNESIPHTVPCTKILCS